MVLLAGNLLIGLTVPKELKLVFLDVGQGIAIHPARTGKDIDRQRQWRWNIGEDVLLPFLLNDVSSLDWVIMSHSHDGP